MSADPLSLLRDSTISNKPVVLLNGAGETVTNISEAKTIKFSDNTTFPRDVPTNFKKTNAAETDTYTLETLIFLVQNAKLDNSAYFKECRTRGIEHVSIVDKRKILDYLTGKVDQSPNVSLSTSNEKRARDDTTLTESLTKKAKVAPPQSEDSKKVVEKVNSREREIITRSSVLQGTKNFTHAINLAKQLVLGKDVPPANRTNTTQKAGHKSSTKPTTTTTPVTAAAKSQKLSSKDKIPLVIVPAAPTAKFTLYNIKQFLEDQKYIDSQELREGGLKKPERVTIERKKPNGQIVPYHVVDSVAQFKQSDWDRVCCVFVAGQLWQFKGWKWERPVDLFSNVKGFYPKWNSDKVNSPASEWAVTEVNIHRSKRHMDRATVSQFWDALDSYNATHKPYLNF
ncbi:RNA pol II accessory factor, Cdc73 family-domain-containing protein [Gilbertella persicaria]|uniref:RNA pol II accessory factor, Cdc73 family-domain-containing protein n=1 Tax=Gilbertella persicaria TaxID=101096 RepID=UPI0022206981|nr:RNA pol II accessory factor, Cdc73 family-domain-containing protein [Gilbertella persicaria]KAI8083191.1 RNA pol II accessory factor, Cdc73 family-domain-containing protein [Gilbertella persicaria]